jgi:hypothetical protein
VLFPIADNVGDRNDANTGPAGFRIENDDPVTSIRLACGRKIDADLSGPLARFTQ